MPSRANPVANSTQSFWRSNRLHALDNHRTTEALPTEADVLIIGAGYAGASLAHHLLENAAFRDREQSIVIVEAREAVSGATGRNGGHLNADPYTRAAQALDRVGKEAAEEVTQFEIRHMKAIGDVVKRDNIDCDFVITRTTDVCLYDSGAAKQREKLAKLTAASMEGLEDVHFSEGSTAEIMSGIKGAKGCLTHTAGHFYPYKFTMHLLEQAVKKGASLHTHNPVESVSETPDSDGRWTVSTPRGTIRATNIVFATNGYTSSLVPGLQDKIVPVRGICCRIVTPNAPAPYLPTTSILHFSEHEYDYLIQRPTDGSIIVGGARRDYYTQLDSWFNVWDDSKLIEPAKQYFDGYMQRTFFGWENSDADTDSIWTGIMGYTDDGFPYVGNVPHKKGQFIVAGFSGHGMPQAFLSAKAVASMIADGTKLEKTDLPRLYHATPERFESRKEHISVTAYNVVMDKLGLRN